MSKEPTVAPYGTWPSPIGFDQVSTSTATMSSLLGDGEALYWLESLPERGKAVMQMIGDEVHPITPEDASIGSRVQEYGGGAYHVNGGYLAWCDGGSGIVLRSPDGEISALTTPDTDVRYGDLHVNAAQRVIVAIKESPGDPVVTTLVAITFEGREHELCAGSDFYAGPAMNDDGRLAWLEWSIPCMPWDSTRIFVGTYADGALSGVRMVAGVEADDGIACHHPLWNGDRLRFTCDASGYYQLTEWTPGPQWTPGEGTTRALHSTNADIDTPLFMLGNHAHATWPAGDHDDVLAWQWREGVCHLVVVGPDGTRELTSVADVDSVAVAGDRAFAIIDRPAAPRALVEVHRDGTLTQLRCPTPAPDPAYVSLGRSLLFEGRHGMVQAWYYPPTNPEVTGPRGERPPMIVRAHGGPIYKATNAWYPTFQYWTSRGIAVLDVNYSGSAGFGRAYRNRLRGLWGVADVDDCADAAEAVVDAGLADPGRIIIMGSSAGGFTALRSAIVSDRYAGAISLYGISDLRALMDGHKFEAYSTVFLVGRWPEDEAAYTARSPLFHADEVRVPVLMLQGTDDPIVPRDQADRMEQAAQEAGADVTLELFEGEGHGFSSEEARMRSLEAQHEFVKQIFRLD